MGRGGWNEVSRHLCVTVLKGREGRGLGLRDELCTVQCPGGFEQSQLQTRAKKKKSKFRGNPEHTLLGNPGLWSFLLQYQSCSWEKGRFCFSPLQIVLWCRTAQNRKGTNICNKPLSFTHTKCAFLRASSFLSCGNLKCGFAALLGVTAVRHWVVSYRVAPTVLECAFQWPFFQNWF